MQMTHESGRVPARPSDTAHPHARGFGQAAAPPEGTSTMEGPVTGSHQHAAWWPNGAAATAPRLEVSASSRAGQPSYLNQQSASADTAGDPAGAGQQKPSLAGSSQQPPYPRASAPDLTAGCIQPPSLNMARAGSSHSSGARYLPASTDRFADRLTGAESGVSAGPAHDRLKDEPPMAAPVSGPGGLPATYGGGIGPADGSSAHGNTWDAAGNLGSATGNHGGMALQATSGVLGSSGYLQSRPSDAAAGQEALGAAAASLQAQPGGAGMTVHTAVTLPPQSDGAGMTVRAAVSLPAQQAAAGMMSYGSGAATGLVPNAAAAQRSRDVDADLQRSVLDTYAPFTAEQLAARADGLTSPQSSPAVRMHSAMVVHRSFFFGSVVKHVSCSSDLGLITSATCTTSQDNGTSCASRLLTPCCVR